PTDFNATRSINIAIAGQGLPPAAAARGPHGPEEPPPRAASPQGRHGPPRPSREWVRDDRPGGRLPDRRGGGGPPPPRAPRGRTDRPPTGRPDCADRSRAPGVSRDQALGDRRHGGGPFHLQRGRRDGPRDRGGGPGDPRRRHRVGPRREESPSARRGPGDHGRTDDGPRGEGEGDPDAPQCRRRLVAARRRGGLTSRGSARSYSTSTGRYSTPETPGSARSTRVLPRSAATRCPVPSRRNGSAPRS